MATLDADVGSESMSVAVQEMETRGGGVRASGAGAALDAQQIMSACDSERKEAAST